MCWLYCSYSAYGLQLAIPLQCMSLCWCTIWSNSIKHNNRIMKELTCVFQVNKLQRGRKRNRESKREMEREGEREFNTNVLTLKVYNIYCNEDGEGSGSERERENCWWHFLFWCSHLQKFSLMQSHYNQIIFGFFFFYFFIAIKALSLHWPPWPRAQMSINGVATVHNMTLRHTQ